MDTQEGKASIAGYAALKLPLALPWIPSASPVQPGITFHSRQATSSDPWSKVSPFDPQWLQNATIQYLNDDGGMASFHLTRSESSTELSEHLSVAFGITVGCKWLNASVTGGYDKDTLENTDSCKTSMKASFRAGSIVLVQRPRLSKEACAILKHQGGLPAFKERFGDYYVAGYRLGGDAAVIVSESQTQTVVNETLSVKVSVKVLFIEASKRHEKLFQNASAGSSYRLHGFDTLELLRIPPSPPVTLQSGLLVSLADKNREMEKKCVKLAQRVTDKVNALGLSQGEVLDKKALDELLRSSLVVEVILLPMSTLREVVEWSTSRDIIGF